MDILYIIPARAGSKGIPGKNTKILGNKPLISYTIECALQIAEPACICISTDDEKVMRIAEMFGIKILFKRPSNLCTDTASQYDVIKHAIEYYKHNNRHFDTIVLLQPTSPFRKPEHIKDAIKLFNNEIDMVVSVCSTKANPYFVLFEENDKGYLIKSKKGNFNRRQDCPQVWQYNGAIYVINCNSMNLYENLGQFNKIKKYIMDEESSIDIDSELDFEFAEFKLKFIKK